MNRLPLIILLIIKTLRFPIESFYLYMELEMYD